MKEPFRRISEATAAAVGSSHAFMLVVVLTVAWIIVGIRVGFSDTWQLTMSTVASQVTLLIAFLLQNTQSRDTRALQLKLDELLRATERARNEMIRLEDLSDEQLGRLEEEFARLRRRRGGAGPEGLSP
jgi:low affinity Fe/Cu permease